MGKFLVWGLGKSGISAVKLLKSKGFDVLHGDDAKGDRWEDFIGCVDTLVLSPGIPPRHPLWKEALKREIEVIGELELAFRFFGGEVIAVTGTDGKSTTTKLTYLMLSSYMPHVYEAGNIGTPLSEIVLKDPKATVIVEVSSFQGKTLSSFKPSVGAFLNFSPDHLDWHPSLEDYLLSKYNVFKRQEEGDILLITPQEELKNVPTGARKIDIISSTSLDGEEVRFGGEVLFRTTDLRLRGDHNLKNAIFASLIAKLLGVPTSLLRDVLRNFRGLPFRMEHVATIRGVEIYNDSKSTTPNSLRAALESFPDHSVLLIAGGKDKGADFYPLREVVSRKVKLALLIGETREMMKAAFGCDVDTKTLSSLEDAVSTAMRSATAGDFILFSPGCSSFDMFSDYIERGMTFNRLVKAFETA